MLENFFVILIPKTACTTELTDLRLINILSGMSVSGMSMSGMVSMGIQDKPQLCYYIELYRFWPNGSKNSQNIGRTQKVPINGKLSEPKSLVFGRFDPLIVCI